MNNTPKEQPLMTTDSEGKQIKVGDKVAILSMPQWFISDDSSPTTSEVKSYTGPVMIAYEIDEDGYVWLETMTRLSNNNYESHNFGMEPNNLLII